MDTVRTSKLGACSSSLVSSCSVSSLGGDSSFSIVLIVITGTACSSLSIQVDELVLDLVATMRLYKIITNMYINLLQ